MALLVLDESEYREFLTEASSGKRITSAQIEAARIRAASKSNDEKRILGVRAKLKLHKSKLMFSKRLARLVRLSEEGNLTSSEAKSLIRKIFSAHYLSAFRAGRFAQLGFVANKYETPSVVKQFSNIVNSQMKYMRAFVKELANGYTSNLPPSRRLRMYVDALDSVYDAGRVSALPTSYVYEWIGLEDDATCPSCKYMHREGPFSAGTLPCYPKDGTTVCLSNCRDEILARPATLMELEGIGNGFTRAEHLANLRYIKDNRKRFRRSSRRR